MGITHILNMDYIRKDSMNILLNNRHYSMLSDKEKIVLERIFNILFSLAFKEYCDYMGFNEVNIYPHEGSLIDIVISYPSLSVDSCYIFLKHGVYNLCYRHKVYIPEDCCYLVKLLLTERSIFIHADPL